MLMVERSFDVDIYTENVNANDVSMQEALFLWLLLLLTQSASANVDSPYLQGLWSTQLKAAVVKILTIANETIMSSFRMWTRDAYGWRTENSSTRSPLLFAWQAAEFAQTLFELHIEIYSEMTNPASSVDDAHRKAQEARMRLWAQASADTVQPAFQTCAADQNHERIIALRYLWASVMFTKLTNPTKKSHVLTCLNDLQGLLEHAEVAEIYLPNNTAIPVISASAVEQEISKVQTLEFFMSVFDSDNSEPESVIMKLEPVLEYDEATRNSHPSDSKVEQILNFRSFLSAGDASLTLFLWKRLQNAYTAISYNTKVVSCLLRSIETVVQEIANNFNRHESASECQMSLLRWLRDADDLTVKVLGKVADDKAAFECIDESHLKTSMSAILILIRIVYGFVLFDDQLRVGDISPPSFRNATASKNFEKSRDRFREMHVRLWTLLYLMVKEFTVQMPAAFDDAELDLILMVRCVHAALGERHYCKHCNKLFVRVAKTELFSFASAEDLSLDIAQVIFDLYQIRLSAGYGDVDHGCMAEPLEKDKRTAQTLVPMIMDYVKRLNVKDVMRSDLKTTIERIQHALGQPKPSTAVSFNRRAVSGYLKSVINPQRVYQALRGIGELELKVVHTESSAIAMQGWYLLLGNLTLTKYRSVKRVNPTPTDDLDNALAYLRQDIEHNAASWESWYRLAQVHDAKIEDSLIWNSNKLNDGRAELATMERNSINAYTMATAIAMRTAGDDASTKKLLDDMSFEFACRLYSSSRPPLDMEAFSTKKAVRHLSDHRSQAMSEEPLFKPMSKYNIWSLAAHLIRKSISGDCSHWTRYYILGKCLWKMFNSTTNIETRHPTTIDDVLDTLIEAVNRVPKKERSSEPILEPHFKLVSCVHKLQDRNVINVSQAVGYLQATSYARNIQVKEDDHGRPHWETYILSALKKLQNADKSGWHHRITARAAHVIYDHDRSIAAALGAKHQFADSIFTKNMTMQVWKPENERAGRHYVYTGRYLHFFVEILDKLKDRSNLEQVVRKIRRKTTDFINHTQVWENAVTAYVDLLRRIGSIPHGKERALFDNITFDEFTRQSEKLEQWAHEPETTTTYLDIIKDAIEMKKLNNSLMKGPAIDDLIGDAYACMYELYVSQLPPEEQAPPQPMVSLPQGTFINMTHQTAPSGDDSRDRMRLNNLLSGQTDGVSGLTPEATPKVTGLGIIDPGSDTVSAPPTDVVRVPAPAKPGRAKTITKREVQKKAEGAIGKPPPIKTPTLTKRSISINIPSIKRTASEDRNDDDDGSVRGHANVASGVSSRRGSVSRRNSPNLVADGMDDEGGDGDNEEDEDDGNESEASDADEDETKASKKRLFPGLAAGDDEADEVEEDEEGEDEEIDENTEDERMSDAKAEQDDEIEGLEIPDSQELTGKARKDADGMDTD